jgi:hypothetical protein
LVCGLSNSLVKSSEKWCSPTTKLCQQLQLAKSCMLRFFFPQFCDCSGAGDHPQYGELAKFGCRSERKVENFENLAIFWWPSGPTFFFVVSFHHLATKENACNSFQGFICFSMFPKHSRVSKHFYFFLWPIAKFG